MKTTKFSPENTFDFLPFETCDFDCFGGSEEFADGSVPMIARRGGIDIVVDGTGVGIYFAPSAICNDVSAFLKVGSNDKPVAKSLMMGIAASLPDALSPEVVRALGFQVVG